MARRTVRVGRPHAAAQPAASTESVILELTGIAPTGEAIGRHAGLVVFVPLGLPGEVAEVRITERRKHFARGEVVAIRTPAPERVTPVCAYFGRCGGCDWQHIDYAAQVALKTALVREQLERIGRLGSVEVRPCVPSPVAYQYRNHARMAVAPDGRLGYRARNAQRVVAVDDCPILEPALAAHVHEWHERAGRADPGDEVDLRGWQALVSVNGVGYRVRAGAFFQANTLVAGGLVEAVMAVLAPRGQERVLELYCGVGLFTVPVGRRVAQMVGVESSPISAGDAVYNLAAAGVEGTILIMDAGEALASNAVRYEAWDAVILDPPRTGVDGAAMEALVALSAPKLIYVSCEPATLARDARFLGEHGYTVSSVQPFDMFPQTHHVETLAVFTLNDGG